MSNFNKFLEKCQKEDFVTGWMTERGHVIIIRSYNHLPDAIEYMKPKQRYAEFSKWIEEVEDRQKDMAEGWERCCNEDGAGWHIYEMERDDLNYKTYLKIIDIGWLRIAFQKNSSILSISGRPKAIKSQYNRIEVLKYALENEFWESCSNIKIESKPETCN